MIDRHFANRPRGLRTCRSIANAASCQVSNRHRARNSSSRLDGIGSRSHSPVRDRQQPVCRTAYRIDPSICLHCSILTGLPGIAASDSFHSHTVAEKLIDNTSSFKVTRQFNTQPHSRRGQRVLGPLVRARSLIEIVSLAITVMVVGAGSRVGQFRNQSA